MSEFSMRQMDAGFKSLTKTVKDGFSKLYEFIANLNLPDLFRKQNEVIIEGFSDQITATIMTQLLEKSARVSSAEVMLKAHNKRLETRQDRYQHQVNNIMDRTTKTIKKEKLAAENQIRQLDDPVLSLIEEYAQNRILSDYSVFTQPALDYIKEHNHINQDVRAYIINSSVAKTLSVIENYIEDRSKFEDAISESVFDNEIIELVFEDKIADDLLCIPFAIVDNQIYAMPSTDPLDDCSSHKISNAESWNSLLEAKKDSINDRMREVPDPNLENKLLESVMRIVRNMNVSETQKERLIECIEDSVNTGLVRIAIPQ